MTYYNEPKQARETFKHAQDAMKKTRKDTDATIHSWTAKKVYSSIKQEKVDF